MAIVVGCVLVSFLLALALVLPTILFLDGGDWVYALPLMEVISVVLLRWVIRKRYGEYGLLTLFRARIIPTVRAQAVQYAAVAAAIVFAFQLATEWLLQRTVGPLPPVQQVTQELLLAPPLVAGIAVVTIVVFAPLSEELLFRGVLFQGLQRRWGWWASAGVSSVVFAALHFEPTLVGSAVIFGWVLVFGFVSCHLLMRTGTLITCITFHALANAASTADFYVRQALA